MAGTRTMRLLAARGNKGINKSFIKVVINTINSDGPGRPCLNLTHPTQNTTLAPQSARLQVNMPKGVLWTSACVFSFLDCEQPPIALGCFLYFGTIALAAP